MRSLFWLRSWKHEDVGDGGVAVNHRKGIFVVALLFLVTLGATSCGVRAPGRVETFVATAVKHRVSVGGKKDVSPFPVTADSIAAGKRNFGYYCFTCHGLDEKNPGVPFAEKMSPPVPPLTSASVQGYTDGQLKWVIENGVSPSGMPASKGILNDKE